MRFRRAVLGVSLLVAAVAASSCHAMQYRLVDLNVLAGGPGSEARAINSNGYVLGSCSAGGKRFACTWKNGVCEPVGSPDRSILAPEDINANGEVVGWSPAFDHSGSAYCSEIYSGGVVSLLGPLDEVSDIARGINDLGQVVGYAYYEFHPRAFVWQNGGDMRDLGTLGGISSQACDINNASQIVGTSTDSQNNECAFLYENGTMRSLGLGQATAINDNGQVVGVSNDQAVLWEDGVMKNIMSNSVGGSSATDINNYGLVVGGFVSSRIPWQTKAYAWQNGVMLELPTLGGNHDWAFGVNDAGQIVGYSMATDGNKHAVLWEPVPEPSSILALISGLAGLGGFAIRRRK